MPAPRELTHIPMNSDESPKPPIDPARIVSNFLNRRIYKELTLETLSKIPDHELEQVIIDYVSTKFTSRRSELAVVSKMPRGFQIVYSTWILEAEVNNGGFNQFFVNSSGQFAEMALKSLEALGAKDHYTVVKRAIQLHAEESSNSELQALYAERTAEAFAKSYELTSLDECDTPFYQLGDLGEIRVHYIRLHPDEFVGR